ncbi:MAG: hypothetical protein NVV62_12755 [Terricaulis sp.]|nr:hypothetical protein [Terricaulis sp.]
MIAAANTRALGQVAERGEHGGQRQQRGYAQDPALRAAQQAKPGQRKAVERQRAVFQPMPGRHRQMRAGIGEIGRHAQLQHGFHHVRASADQRKADRRISQGAGNPAGDEQRRRDQENRVRGNENPKIERVDRMERRRACGRGFRAAKHAQQIADALGALKQAEIIGQGAAQAIGGLRFRQEAKRNENAQRRKAGKACGDRGKACHAALWRVWNCPYGRKRQR